MQDLITEDALTAMGIQLSDDDMKALVQHSNDTLNERVGADIIESLSDEQLEEYVTLQQSDDEAKLMAWMAENVPDLKQIVENERDIVLGELADTADSL